MFVSNPDVIISDRELFEIISNIYAKDEHIALAYPLTLHGTQELMLYKNSKMYYTSHYVAPFLWVYKKESVVDSRDKSFYTETNRVNTTFFSLRKDYYENVGMLDENLFMYNEEDELLLKCKTYGYKIVMFPNLIVYHKVGESLKRSNTKDKWFVTRNIIQNLVYLYYAYCCKRSFREEASWWIKFLMLNVFPPSVYKFSLYPIKLAINSYKRFHRIDCAKKYFCKELESSLLNFLRMLLPHYRIVLKFKK